MRSSSIAHRYFLENNFPVLGCTVLRKLSRRQPRSQGSLIPVPKEREPGNEVVPPPKWSQVRSRRKRRKRQAKDVNVAEYRKGTCVTTKSWFVPLALAQTANFGNHNLESRIDFLTVWLLFWTEYEQKKVKLARHSFPGNISLFSSFSQDYKSPVKTDATLLGNNSQNCWLLLVASVCTPGYMSLRVVGSCCAKIETGQTLQLRSNGNKKSQQCRELLARKMFRIFERKSEILMDFLICILLYMVPL